MKAQELRIGNYVNFDNNICKIDGICGFAIVRMDAGYTIDSQLHHIKPIPLTEDWLLKFCFKEIGKTKVYIIYDIMQVHLQWCDKKLFWVGCFESERSYFPLDDSLFHIKYVHQLQNLFFALTGTELTIE